jgi:hypothetical protein
MNDYNTQERQAWLRRLQHLDAAPPNATEVLLAIVSLIGLVAIAGWLL